MFLAESQGELKQYGARQSFAHFTAISLHFRMHRSPYFPASKRHEPDAHGAAPPPPQVAAPSSPLCQSPEVYDRVILTAIAARKRQKREAAAAASVDATQFTEMEKQVVALRTLHIGTLLLFECGYRMRLFAEDAEHAAAVLGIRAQRHRAFLEASIPVHRTLFHARRLVNAGFKVGVVKQVDSAAMRTVSESRSAHRKPLQRCVAEVYTRATIPQPENSGEGEENDPARYIMCVVETTVHSKPFFAQALYNVGDETKRSQAFAEDVRIGVFAHDVQSGDSKFDEFEDDGKRQRLQRVLQSLEPIELVLPTGKLSVYTEQILKSFVVEQSSSSGFEEPQCCIRVERLPNGYFEYPAARETYARVFHDAAKEYTSLTTSPKLPELSMCCFGGMWQYLSSLGVAKSLIAPNYSSITNAATSLARPFHLPMEAHRDLDLFVNATTKHGVGSLFSILNHTKTDFGARRLREWIRCPLGSLSEITERQQTIQSLAFPSGALSRLSVPHIMVYEELTTTILPRCKPLLRCLQQIHLGKATPSQTVNALQMLQELEISLNELKGLFTMKRSQATQLERILGGFPTMSVVLSGHLGEIDVKSAKRNDMELAILKRLLKQRSQADKYREFTTRLESLAKEYDSVLQSCRRILQNPSLEYTTFRGGAVSDIRHLIQVNREDLHVAPKDWLVVNSTKKLLRFHPKEIVQLHVQEEVAKQQKQQLIQSVWRQFVSQVDAHIYVMGMNCVDLLATLDALCSLATVAQSYPNYTMPEFVNGDSSLLEIVDGRHPIIEALLEQSSYISNSVFLTSNAASPGSLLVVSGPNMGGKTSLLRMCALIVLLAQMGSFVPATSVRLTAFDGVYTLMHRHGAGFDAQHQSSSCEQELTALSAISQNATAKSLVLIDEIGFGMTAQYAEAVGVAQMLYLVEKVGSHVVFASHLTAVIQRLQTRLGSKCQTKQLEYHYYTQAGEDKATSEVAQEGVTFHYVITDGIASDSFALDTARRAGIPPQILERARGLRDDL